MKKTMLGIMTAAALLAPTALPTAAFAQDWQHNNGGQHDNGNRNGQWRGGDKNWDPSRDYHEDKHYKGRRLGRNDQVYRGGDGRYYCKRSNGTTGTVIGAVGGGLAGNLLGGGTLGTLLGAGGGALLGRSIDRGNVKCR
ncbi:MAG TPA: glycine zipper 2TM domain-containing protein [Sphingomonas sp.]